MRLFDRFFGKRIRVTPEQLGEVFYVAVLRIGQDFAQEFLRSEWAAEFRQRLNTTECNVEIIIFSLFSLELIANEQFGSNALVVRTALRHKVLEHFRHGGWSESSPQVLNHFIDNRFDQYTKAWKSTLGPQGLIRLGDIAFRNIMGLPSAAPPNAAALFCTLRFGATMKGFADIGSKYRVV